MYFFPHKVRNIYNSKINLYCMIIFNKSIQVSKFPSLDFSWFKESLEGENANMYFPQKCRIPVSWTPLTIFFCFLEKRESVITYLCHVVVFRINSQGFEEKGDLVQRFKTENMWF